MTLAHLVAVSSIGAFALLGCVGETDDIASGALASFEASQCRKHGVVRADLTSADGADAGDEPFVEEMCVEYTLNDGTLSVTLIAFSGGCGTHWGGEVALDGDTLVLRGKNLAEGCPVARCGGCQYDLDFVVSGVQSMRPLPVRIELGQCADPSESRVVVTYELTLPVDLQDRYRRCGDL